MLLPLLHAQPGDRGVTVVRRQLDAFQKEPRVALIVAIDQYPNASGFRKLDYATKDANSLAEALSAPDLNYKVRKLLNYEALHNEVRQALKDAAAAVNGKGTLLFFFAGHGGQKDRKQYLATYETGADRLDEFGLPLSEVQEILNSSGAPRKMMFIDACRDEAKAPTGTRGGNDPVESFGRLEESEGLRLLNATGPLHVSYEDARLGHGIFTYFLLKGLQGEAADPYGIVTFHSLATYVSREVRDFSYPTGRLQSPYEAGDAFGDFLLGGKFKPPEAARPDTTAKASSDAAPSDPAHDALERARKAHDPKMLDAFILLFPNSPYANLARVERAGMDASPSKALFEQALSLFDAGETPLALSAFESVLRADPQNLDAAAYQSLLLAFDRSYKEAIDAAETVLRTQPANIVALLARGYAFSSTGHAERAKSDFRQVIDASPHDPRGYLLSGIAATHAQQYELSVRYFSEAIRLRPKFPRALNDRCIAYSRLQRYEEAIQDCNEVLLLQPNYAGALGTRGVVYARQNDYVRATEDYDKALRIWPADVTTLVNRGRARYELKQFDQAIRDFNEALRLRPYYDPAYNSRGSAYFEMKEYGEALKDFAEAIRCKPSEPSYYRNRARAKDKLGDKKGAEADRAKAAELGSAAK